MKILFTLSTHNIEILNSLLVDHLLFNGNQVKF